MNRTKKIYTMFYLICLVAFTGCSSKLAIKALPDNEARMSLSIELGKILEEALNGAMSGLVEIEGSQAQAVIFDIPSIKKSLGDAGFKDIEASAPARSKLNLSFTGRFSFIECAGDRTSVTITPSDMQKFSNSLGEEFKSVMDLFMAPVLSDEVMTKEEYAELVAVVYGQPLADEMMKSTMEIAVTSPKGKTKVHKIPLVDLLTLSEEKTLTSE